MSSWVGAKSPRPRSVCRPGADLCKRRERTWAATVGEAPLSSRRRTSWKGSRAGHEVCRSCWMTACVQSGVGLTHRRGGGQYQKQDSSAATVTVAIVTTPGWPSPPHLSGSARGPRSPRRAEWMSGEDTWQVGMAHSTGDAAEDPTGPPRREPSGPRSRVSRGGGGWVGGEAGQKLAWEGLSCSRPSTRGGCEDRAGERDSQDRCRDKQARATGRELCGSRGAGVGSRFPRKRQGCGFQGADGTSPAVKLALGRAAPVPAPGLAGELGACPSACCASGCPWS